MCGASIPFAEFCTQLDELFTMQERLAPAHERLRGAKAGMFRVLQSKPVLCTKSVHEKTFKYTLRWVPHAHTHQSS